MGIGALGTLVRVPDGRVGTVVYNGLDGIGIKWGRHDPRPEDFEGLHANFGGEPPANFEWFPDAMLRRPEMSKSLGMDCVCREAEVEVLPASTQGEER